MGEAGIFSNSDHCSLKTGVSEYIGARSEPRFCAIESHLSNAQFEIWMVEQIVSENSVNNLVYLGRLNSHVKDEMVERLMRGLLLRQPAFRTTIHVCEGRPIQRINEDFIFEHTVLDCQDWAYEDCVLWVKCESEIPFDLSKSVIRSCLLKNCPYREGEPRGNVLATVVHHVATDFGSLGISVAELNHLYANPQELDEDPKPHGLTYLDFSRNEASILQGARGEELRGYWGRKIANPPSSLLLMREDIGFDAGSNSISTMRVEMPTHLSRQLRIQGRSRSATPYLTLLSIYFAFLHRYSGQEDLIVGSPVSTKSREFKDLVGCFINILPLRVSVSGRDSFMDLLDKVRETVDGARKHMQMPLGEIIRHLGLNVSLTEAGLFQTSLAWDG